MFSEFIKETIEKKLTVGPNDVHTLFGPAFHKMLVEHGLTQKVRTITIGMFYS
jgi:hypothetical protein